MTDRLVLTLLALVALASLAVAPWAATNRETGARSSVLLLPDRSFDFTGRTEPIRVPGLPLVLVTSVAGLIVLVGAGWTRPRVRNNLWLISGALLIVVTSWGLNTFGKSIDGARTAAFKSEVQRAIDNPRPNQDVAVLQDVIAAADELSLDANVAAARSGGLVVRRLPYSNAAFGPAAFLVLVTGGFALLFGLRMFRRVGIWIGQLIDAAAVPATSILLALGAAAVVVLALQPTPMGSGSAVSGAFGWLVGRIDTLWYAYFTMFHDSLGTVNGFAESLKFATPLIFTGLGVAFGFQAGLFNIGAPGQMLLGAIFAMFVGVYMPGPRLLVLPSAILASAIGGGLWGALPGWLKARFGANEVINTILLNFVAASLLLFILSTGPIFAASALRILQFLGVLVVVVVLLLLARPLRSLVGRSPRLAFAALGVIALGGMVVTGLPRPGDAPVVINMPFKVPGSEPKSAEVSPAARLPQLPKAVGIDLARTPGTNIVRIDYAALLAPLVALLTLALLPRVGGRWRRWSWRLGGAVVVAGVVYLIAALLQLNHVPTAIPPTKLNTSFLIALLMAYLFYVFLWRTRWGYELRGVGQAPKAAEYGGASIGRNTILAMAISGALAGMTATHYVLGGALEDFSLRQSIPTGDGFDGIAVALLGNNGPVGIVFAAFLFGVLKNGGSVLNIAFSNLTRDVVSMILALVVLFIAARGFLPERFTNPLLRAAARAEAAAAAEAAATSGSGGPPPPPTTPGGADGARSLPADGASGSGASGRRASVDDAPAGGAAAGADEGSSPEEPSS